MGQRPRATLLKFPGTNCDRETARGLRAVGFETDIVPFTTVDEGMVWKSDLVAFTGGFSYGDYVKAGRFARLEIESKLGNLLDEYRRDGGRLLGICNGFQILIELGLLPESSLIQNEQRRFICKWVSLEVRAQNNQFLSKVPEQFELPIAHMEGRFVTEGMAENYLKEGYVPLLYRNNPNGSERGIAGLQDETGRVFGLMPHPERFLWRRHHYSSDWDTREFGWGYYFFESIFEAVKNERDSEKRRTEDNSGQSARSLETS